MLCRSLGLSIAAPLREGSCTATNRMRELRSCGSVRAEGNVLGYSETQRQLALVRDGPRQIATCVRSSTKQQFSSQSNICVDRPLRFHKVDQHAQVKIGGSIWDLLSPADSEDQTPVGGGPPTAPLSLWIAQSAHRGLYTCRFFSLEQLDRRSVCACRLQRQGLHRRLPLAEG
jgi:hypothetical protein